MSAITAAPARTAGFIAFHAGEAVATARCSSEAITEALHSLRDAVRAARTTLAQKQS